MQALCTGLLRIGLLILFHALVAADLSAQIILDGTLRPENEGLTPPVIPSAGCALLRDDLGNKLPGINYWMPQEAGVTSTSGKNLFHSFRALSLDVDECLTFTGSSTVENLVARVTGGDESVIQGILRSELPNADFFLVNPAGIRLVRPDLEDDILGDILSLPGSFHASTADYLAFSDGQRFPVAGNENPVSIDSDPVAWGFLGGGAAGIVAERTNFLRVVDGERIGLAGGNVHVSEAAKVIANGGEIHLAAVGEAAIELPLDLDDLGAADMANTAFGEIRVDGASEIKAGTTVPGDPMGRIVIRGGRLVVAEFSVFFAGADVEPGQNAMDIVATESVRLSGVSEIASISYAPEGAGGIHVQSAHVEVRNPGTRLQVIAPEGGSGGTLKIEAGEVIVTDQARVRTAATDVDRGGDLVIEADRIEVSQGALVQSVTTGRARGGDVSLAAVQIELTGGGQVLAQTLQDARGGDVTVRASDSLRIDGAAGDAGNTTPSGIFTRSGSATANAGLNGDSGNLRVETPDLTMTGPSLVSASSVTSGRSGVVTISESESVRLIGDERGAPEIATRTFEGNGGGSDEGVPGLVIETGSLEVRNGAAIASSTRGRGEAADIFVNAGSVLLEGLGADGQTAGIFAESLAPDTVAPGEGGTGRIVLEVDRLDLLAGSELSIETQGPGEGKAIEIDALDTIRIAGGTVRSSASPLASARAGDLSIRAGNGIEISDGGLVTASSRRTGSQLAPDAGDIVIEAGGALVMTEGTVETTADAAAGGRILLSAGDRVELLESRVETSVAGGLDIDDAGDIDVTGSEVVFNRSEVLADAELGDGGNIRIAADAYLQSADSIVRASSRFGLDGEILIEGPDSELIEQATRLPVDFLDAAELLRSHCAARAAEQGSFVVRGARGPRHPTTRPLPARMPLPSDLPPPGDTNKRTGLSESEGAVRGPNREQGIALSPVDCERLARLVEARHASEAELRR